MNNIVYLTGALAPVSLSETDRRFLARPIKQRFNMLPAPCPYAPRSVEFRALQALHKLRGSAWVSQWIGAMWWTRSQGDFWAKIIRPLERSGMIITDNRLCKLTESGFAAMGAEWELIDTPEVAPAQEVPKGLLSSMITPARASNPETVGAA